MRDRITRIIEGWYIVEPALFQVICTHDLVENPSMACPVRTGRRRVEYNPAFIREMSDEGLEEALRAEAVRILLKHPYERKPDGCCQQAVSVGSDLVIGDNYTLSSFRMSRPADYGLPRGMAYEWYSRRIQSMLPPEGDTGETDEGYAEQPLREDADRNRDLSELWDEDELAVVMINGVIEGCTSWGSLAGVFAETLKASTKARIDWRNVFSGFRASILSSKRKLTRMRPNRRTGFQNMGSIRRFDTRLLVAVDVSGSITSESLSHFFGVVNSAFRYGFEAVDVLQFDHGVQVVQSLRKAIKDVAVLGRGGTSFQHPVDYAHKNGYDGLVILTDGCAPEPVIPRGMRCKIVWVCQDAGSFEAHREWMSKYGRVCKMELK